MNGRGALSRFTRNKLRKARKMGMYGILVDAGHHEENMARDTRHAAERGTEAKKYGSKRFWLASKFLVTIREAVALMKQ